MTDTNMTTLLRDLPKCEHHIHLEGALTPAILFKLAAKNSIVLPDNDGAFSSPETLAERYNKFVSLDDFLHYYYIGMSVLVDAADYEALAWDYLQHASRDGVMHTEMFFDPQAHLERGVSFTTVQSGFAVARQRAEAELGITSELICCFLRHLPAAQCESTFAHPDVQASIDQGHFVGIGLDSSEKDFPPTLFKELYRGATAKSLRRTAHAGEEGPPQFIADALDHLGVERIDHGIRLAEDPALMARVADQNVLLTICPWSNVFLRCVSTVAELPIRTFLDAGIKFSLNSDDPAYFGNHYILDNYVAVHEAFNLSIEEWTTICQNGINGSWCGDDRKQEMLVKLARVIADYKQAHSS